MIYLFLFTLLFTGCSQPAGYNHIKVTEVIDGDTVRLSNGKLLRYIGLDTPEVRVRNKGKFVYNPQPFSLEAKGLNKKLIENKFIRVEFDVEKLDSYGRILGYCFRKDMFINAKLIEEGMAVLYTKPPNVKYTELFIKAQEEARRLRKGLWGTYESISSNDAYKFINQIRAVEGRVLSTYKSSKVVYLNFGSNYKTDFTVIIFNDCLKFFRDKGIEPEAFYRNKLVKVWGRIREYNGPEIIVCMPYQIKVMNES